MDLTNQIDNMVEAAWRVIRSDFDEDAVLQWKMSARDCLVNLVGEEHFYTEEFDRQIRERAVDKVLACCGILSAARETTITGDDSDVIDVSCKNSGPKRAS
jgi:hypothetical protein